MKKTTFILSAIALAIVGFLGCTTPPNAFERYLFDHSTNTVPVVVTNAATGAVETKQVATVEVVPSAELKSWSALISGVVNTISPGSGSAVGIALLGGAGIFGFNRQKKLTAVQRIADGFEEQSDTLGTLAENFAQSIETLRAVVKATPNGEAIDAKFVESLRNNQMNVGLLAEAVNLVKNSVNSTDAKRAAAKILAQLPKPIPTT